MAQPISISVLNEQLAEICEAGFHLMGPAQAKRTGKFRLFCKDQKKDLMVVFVAHADDKYVGHAKVVWDSDYPHFSKDRVPEIQDLNVLPAYRNQGIGTAIINACETQAFTRSNVVGIGVGLHPGYNNAQKLYPKLGYIPDGHGVHYGNQPVVERQTYIFDDDLVLFFRKIKAS